MHCGWTEIFAGNIMWEVFVFKPLTLETHLQGWDFLRCQNLGLPKSSSLQGNRCDNETGRPKCGAWPRCHLQWWGLLGGVHHEGNSLWQNMWNWWWLHTMMNMAMYFIGSVALLMYMKEAALFENVWMLQCNNYQMTECIHVPRRPCFLRTLCSGAFRCCWCPHMNSLKFIQMNIKSNWILLVA